LPLASSPVSRMLRWPPAALCLPCPPPPPPRRPRRPPRPHLRQAGLHSGPNRHRLDGK